MESIMRLRLDFRFFEHFPDGEATVFMASDGHHLVLARDIFIHGIGELSVNCTFDIHLTDLIVELKVRGERGIHSGLHMRLQLVNSQGDAVEEEERDWSGAFYHHPWTIITPVRATAASTKRAPGADDLAPVYRAWAPRKRKRLHAQVKVYYATNREPEEQDGETTYGQRDFVNRLHFGAAEISIPDNHRLGTIGSTGLKRVWKMITLSDDQVKVRRTLPLSTVAFEQQTAVALTKNGQKEGILLFVHGYNVDFSEALIRTAQIGHDINFNGILVAFAWPSVASPAGYIEDGNSAGVSETPLARLIAKLLAISTAPLRILAHSMGNRTVLGALKTLQIEHPESPTIDQLVFAAPDVDTQKFRDDLALVSNRLRAATLYASEKDRALWVSEWLGSYPRAGLTPPVTTHPGLHSIECIDIDPSFLGHSYFASCRPMLEDLHQLLVRKLTDPRSRGLTPRPKDAEFPFWTLSAGGDA